MQSSSLKSELEMFRYKSAEIRSRHAFVLIALSRAEIHRCQCSDERSIRCDELYLTHVSDFPLRLPLLWLLRGPVEPSLVVDVPLLLQPQSGTVYQKQSVLRISHAAQKDIEDGTVRAILYRLTQLLSALSRDSLLVFPLFRDPEVFWTL